MKKMILAAALIIGCSMYQKAEAQISFSLNIGSQPEWGPVGYDHASYYYMPDVDAYYDVPNHQYVYMERNRWVHANVLPARYNFDPYNSYKVVVNERNPWERAATYRTKYASYRGKKQVIIRDSREAKYRNHWQDKNSYNGRGPGNSDYGHDKDAHGRGNGHDKGHGHGNGKH